MACTAIITDDGIDQIVEHEGDFARIVKREVKDLKAMGIGLVYTKEFADESCAYDWAHQRTQF